MAPGFEADDVLGTLANRAAESGWRVRILSGDRDLFQLVDDSRDIAVMYMGGGPYARSSGPTLIDEGVVAKLGVMPTKVVDLKALTGDSSDNIPGVKGVGPKTAINLLKENDDLDAVYRVLAEVEAEGPKASRGAIKGALKGKLSADRDNAYLSRKLAEILVDIPLPEEPALELGPVDGDGLQQQLEDPGTEQPGASGAGLRRHLLHRRAECQWPSARIDHTQTQAAAAPASASADRAAIGSSVNDALNEPSKPPKRPCRTCSLELISTPARPRAWWSGLMACRDPLAPVAVDTETTDLNPFKAQLVGVGVCWGPEPADLAYIPIGHRSAAERTLDSAAEPWCSCRWRVFWLSWLPGWPAPGIPRPFRTRNTTD